MLSKDLQGLYEAYKGVYEETDSITDDLVEEVIGELFNECVEEGYTIDEAAYAIEEAATEYLMELNPYAPAGSKEARSYAQSTSATKRGVERKAAVKGAVERVKAKAKGIKAAAGIAGSIAKDEARRAGRAAVQSVKSGVEKKKEQVKSGIKGFLGKAAKKVASKASSVAARLGEEVQQLDELSDKKVQKTLKARERRFDRSVDSGAPNREFHQLRRTEKLVASRNRRTGSNIPVDEEVDTEVQQLDEISDKKVQQVVNARNRRFARSVDSGAPNREFHQAVRSNKLAARRNQRTGSNVRTDSDIDGTRGIRSREETSRMREIKVNKESVELDTWDVVLEYLITNGHADTNSEALYIMSQMNEEMIQSILEGSYEDRIAANNKKYDAARKRAAQRAQARNDARARGQTGNVPGVGYVSPGAERTSYTDSAGTERHHSGAKMP